MMEDRVDHFPPISCMLRRIIIENRGIIIIRVWT